MKLQNVEFRNLQDSPEKTPILLNLEPIPKSKNTHNNSLWDEQSRSPKKEKSRILNTYSCRKTIEFNGYDTLFEPKLQNGYQMFGAIDDLILNPFHMKQEQTVESLDKKMKRLLETYNEFPYAIDCKRARCANFLTIDGKNTKDELKENKQEPFSEKKEKDASGPKRFITALSVSKKYEMFVYCEETLEKNNSHYSLYIVRFADINFIGTGNEIKKEKAPKSVGEVFFLSFDHDEKAFFINFRDSISLYPVDNGFIDFKNEKFLNLADIYENNDSINSNNKKVDNKLRESLQSKSVGAHRDNEKFNYICSSIIDLKNNRILIVLKNEIDKSNLFLIIGNYLVNPRLYGLYFQNRVCDEICAVDPEKKYLCFVYRSLDFCLYRNEFSDQHDDKKDEKYKRVYKEILSNIPLLRFSSTLLYNKEAHSDTITAMNFYKNFNDEFLLTGDKANIVKIWKIDENEIKNTKDFKPFIEIQANFLGEIFSLSAFELIQDEKESKYQSLCVISSGSDHYLRVWKILLNNDEKKEGSAYSLLGLSYQKEEIRHVEYLSLRPHNRDEPIHNIIVANGKKCLRIYDFDSLQIMTENVRMHYGKVRALCLTPNNKMIISASEDKLVTVWDSKNLEVIFKVELEAPANSIKSTMDNKYLILGCSDKSLQVIDLDQKKLLKEFREIFGKEKSKVFNEEQGPITEILIYPGDKFIISAGFNIKFWEINAMRTKTFPEIRVISTIEMKPQTRNEILAIALTPDGKKIISGGTKIDNKIKIWEIKMKQRIDSTANNFFRNNFNETSKSNQKSMEMTLKKNKFVNEVKPLKGNGHDKAVNDLAVSPNNRYLASGSLDKRILLWDLETYELINEFFEDQEINRVKFFPQGEYLLSGSADNFLRVYDMKHKCLIGKMEGHFKAIKDFEISNDGETIYSGSADKIMRVWSLKTFEELRCLEGHSQPITCMACNKDCVFTASSDRTIRIWEFKTGAQKHVFRENIDRINDLKYSDSNEILISLGEDQIRFWDLKTKEEIIYPNPDILKNVLAIDILEEKNSQEDFSLDIDEKNKEKKTAKAMMIIANKNKELYKIFFHNFHKMEVKEEKFNEPSLDTINILKIIENNILVTGDLKRNLSKWDINSGKIESTKETRHFKKINSIIKVSEYVITCGGEVIIWDKKTFEKKQIIDNINAVLLRTPFYEENSKSFYYLNEQNIIKQYSLKENKDLKENIETIIKKEDENAPLISNFILISLKRIACICGTKDIEFIRNDQNGIIKPKLHTDRITTLEVIPTNSNNEKQLIVTGSRDGSIIIWSNNEARCQKKCHNDEIFCIMAIDIDKFISVGHDNKIIKWSAKVLNDLEYTVYEHEKPDYYTNEIDRNYFVTSICTFTVGFNPSLAMASELSAIIQKFDNEKPNWQESAKRILIVGSKTNYLEFTNINGQVLKKINYEEDDIAEENEKKLKHEKSLKELQMLRTFSRKKTMVSKNILPKNYEFENDNTYPVVIYVMRKCIFLGYKNGKIYSISKLEKKIEAEEEKRPVQKHSFHKKKKSAQVTDLKIERKTHLEEFDLKNFEFNQDNSKYIMKAEYKFKGHTKDIISLITSRGPNAKLISSSLDNTVKFWNLKTGNLLTTIKVEEKISTKIDFTITRPVFIVPNRLILLNNSIFDISNELVLFKPNSNTFQHKIFCPYSKKFLSFDMKHGILYKSSLIDGNLLAYMKEYSKLKNFFNNPEHLLERVLNGSCMLYPFYCNFLHLNILFLNNVFTLINIEDIENIPFEAFIQKNSLEQSPISMLLEKSNKNMLDTYFRILFKSFRNSKTSIIQKMKLFHHEFKFYINFQNDQTKKFMIKRKRKNIDKKKIEEDILEKLYNENYENTDENVPTYNIYDYFITLIKKDKQDLSIISAFFDHSFLELDMTLRGSELMRPELVITDNEQNVKNTIEREIIRPNKTEDNQATIKAKIIALPFITDSSKEYIREFFEELIFIDVKNPVFSNNILKIVTNYKWKSIYRKKYLALLGRFLFVLACFLTNFAYLFPLKAPPEITSEVALGESAPSSNFPFPAIIVSTIFDIFLIIYFVIIFFSLMKKMKQISLKFFISVWNMVDVFLCFVVVASCVIDMIQMGQQDLEMTGPKIIYSYAMFFLWIRIISFFRGFDETGFLLRLIFQVILDIRYFLLFILIFILGFAYSAFLLQADIHNKYNHFYVWMVFYRLVLGDLNLYDDYIEEIEISYFLWILLMCSTILLSIILLNLLISIIQNSFNNVISAEQAMKTFERLDMVNDFELGIKKKTSFKKAGKYLLYVYNGSTKEKDSITLEDIVKENLQNIEKKVVKIQDLVLEKQGIIDEEDEEEQQDFVNEAIENDLDEIKEYS